MLRSKYIKSYKYIIWNAIHVKVTEKNKKLMYIKKKRLKKRWAHGPMGPQVRWGQGAP